MGRSRLQPLTNQRQCGRNSRFTSYKAAHPHSTTESTSTNQTSLFRRSDNYKHSAGKRSSTNSSASGKELAVVSKHQQYLAGDPPSAEIMEEKPSSSIVHQMHWIADGGEDSSWRLKTMLHDRVNNNSLRRPVLTRLLTVNKPTRTNNAAVRHNATGNKLSSTPTKRHVTARIPNHQLSRLRKGQARRRRKKEIGNSYRYSPKHLAASAPHFEPASGRRRRRNAQHTSEKKTSPDIKDASPLFSTHQRLQQP